MDSDPSTTPEGTLWRVVAQFTRENAERDVILAEIKKDVAHLISDVSNFSVLAARLDRLDESLQSLRRSFDTSPARLLTDERVSAVERLLEQLQRRGTIDLFDQDEMATIRAVLSDMGERQRDYRAIQQKVSDLTGLRDSLVDLLENRLVIVKQLSEQVDEIRAWQEAHRDTHESINKQMYQITFGPSLSAEEVSAIREMLTHWGKFFSEHLEAVKEMLIWWRGTQVRGGLVQNQVINAVFTILLVAPIVTVITILAHKIAGF